MTLLLFPLMAVRREVQAADGVTDATVAEKSAAATTAADLEALAAYFSDKATEAGKRVELHQDLLTGLKQGPAIRRHHALSTHCKALVSSARRAQEAYQTLADDYAGLAIGASK